MLPTLPPSTSLPISVVIPCYRCGKTIQRAVDSIARQTALPAEVLLVDDFSNDETVAQLQNLASFYPAGWIKIIALSRNGGPGVARNEGIGRATQDYIALLDSDDAWHPQKLSLQYAWMVAHPDIMLSGHPSVRYSPQAEAKVFAASEISEKYISSSRLLLSNVFSCRSMMFRRELSVPFDPHKRYMEDHWWLMQAAAGYEMVDLKIPLAFIYKADYGEEGLSSQLWQMEKSELDNYYQLGCTGKIPLWLVLVLWLYSLSKYLKRVFISLARYFLRGIK